MICLFCSRLRGLGLECPHLRFPFWFYILMHRLGKVLTNSNFKKRIFEEVCLTLLQHVVLFYPNILSHSTPTFRLTVSQHVISLYPNILSHCIPTFCLTLPQHFFPIYPTFFSHFSTLELSIMKSELPFLFSLIWSIKSMFCLFITNY